MEKSRRIRSERTHLFEPDAVIDIMVELGGSPDTAQLKRAIDCAVRANESLNCKIVLAEDGTAGYEKLPDPVYSVEISKKDWKEILSEQEKRAFALTSGELIRFFILNGGSSLLIMAHHFAGDGLSVVYLVEDIMTALSGRRLRYQPLKIATLDSFPKSSGLSPLTKLLLNKLNRDWRKTGKAFSFADYQTMFDRYWNGHRTFLCCDTLSPDEVGRLCAKAKQANISVNSLLTAAFLQAFEKTADTGFAVNIREKANRSMANYASGIAIRYRYDKNSSFLQNARKVHRRIYKKLNNVKSRYLVLQFIGIMEPTLLDAACMAVFGNYQNKTAEYLAHLIQYDNRPKDISISNLTKLDIPQQYGSYSIRQIAFVAPVIQNARRVFGIATLGNEMCITMHVIEDEYIEREKAYFAKAMRILKEIPLS